MLPDHDVCITDWHNAREVSNKARTLRVRRIRLAPHPLVRKARQPVHTVAVCQPCVQVLTAASVMAQADNPHRPRSMTLMAGRSTPASTRPRSTNSRWVNPSTVRTQSDRPRADAVCRRRAPRLPGLHAAHRVHVHEHRAASQGASRLYENLALGQLEKAKSTKDFYDEYFAVLDLTAEFYLETDAVDFSRRRGSRPVRWITKVAAVDPGAIRRMALLTVEGRRTISAPSVKPLRRTICARGSSPT